MAALESVPSGGRIAVRSAMFTFWSAMARFSGRTSHLATRWSTSTRLVSTRSVATMSSMFSTSLPVAVAHLCIVR